MMSETKPKELLNKSAGVLHVPSYVRAAAGVRGRGGEGVLLGHKDGEWSVPVFYNIGGISVGALFGAEAGEIAMLLMKVQALDTFVLLSHSLQLRSRLGRRTRRDYQQLLLLGVDADRKLFHTPLDLRAEFGALLRELEQLLPCIVVGTIGPAYALLAPMVALFCDLLSLLHTRDQRC